MPPPSGTAALDLLPWVYFNETTLQLVDDLKLLFPGDPLLKLVSPGLKIFMASKKKTLQQAFAKSLGPYVAQIHARDEQFFMAHSAQEYKQDYKRVKQDGRLSEAIDHIKSEVGRSVQRKKGDQHTSMFESVVNALKGKWADFDADNKDVIWKYMSQLAKLNELCIAAEAAEAAPGVASK